MSRFLEKAVKRDIEKDKSSKAKTALGELVISASERYRRLYGEVDLQEKSVKPQGKQGRKEAPRPLNLKEIVARNVDRFIGLDFHTFIYPDAPEEETKAKYREDFTVPEGARMPKEYEMRFPIINAVDPRIPISEKDRKAGIEEWTDTRKITDRTPISEKP